MVTKRIVIDEDFEFDDNMEQIVTDDDFSHSVGDTLRRIAELVDQGYTSGYEPRWYLEEVTDDRSK